MQRLSRGRSVNQAEDYDIQEDVETYLDMQMLNPDWEFAAKHGMATKPGITRAEHKKEKCITCFKLINKDPFPLC